MSDPAPIEIRDVSRRYRARRGGDRVGVDGVSLRIEQGQWVALLGPNGSGKSTLLRMLVGLDAPSSGRIGVLGGDPRTRRSADRVGVVFQRTSLDPMLTVREILLAQAALFGITGREARRRVEEGASGLGVADRLDDRVSTLSGGLARRVDLARALVNEPALLLLDEPTAGLDLSARHAFLDAIARLHERSLTIVMTTHDMDEAERADRVVMLDEGRIVADDSPGALRASCGGRIVRWRSSDPDDEIDRLQPGAVRAPERGDTRIVTIEEDDRAQALVGLLASKGISFECGPPTLADAYLELTGRTLADEAAP